MVKEIQSEMRMAEDLQPDRGALLLMRLSSLLGNILDEILEAEYAYNVVLVERMNSEEAANRATIRAKTSPEYLRLQEAQNTKTLAVELTRALKFYLRGKQEEHANARYQQG